MLPGLGVGGYCLTKDALLASWARMNLFGSENPLLQSETGVNINDKMPLYAFQFLQSQYKGSLKDKKFCCLALVISMMLAIPAIHLLKVFMISCNRRELKLHCMIRMSCTGKKKISG